jgi:hypothetical protein
MSNMQIITIEASLKGLYYDGTNLKTYNEWKKAGKQVKQGQKAILQVPLWKYTNYTDKETKEEKNKFILSKTAYLFAEHQVTEITKN